MDSLAKLSSNDESRGEMISDILTDYRTIQQRLLRLKTLSKHEDSSVIEEQHNAESTLSYVNHVGRYLQKELTVLRKLQQEHMKTRISEGETLQICKNISEKINEVKQIMQQQLVQQSQLKEEKLTENKKVLLENKDISAEIQALRSEVREIARNNRFNY
ncbi:MAG: hypothetical protein WD512_18135 [Candidatus Paceibacterota bacterium]